MININKLTPQATILFENNDEKLLLKTGLNITIITDETEHDEVYTGCIQWVTEDEIQLENKHSIKFEYIEEIIIN